MRIILILLLYLFNHGQSVQQKWQSEFDQIMQEEVYDQKSKKGTDDPTFNVQSSDGPEYENDVVEADSKSDHESQDDMLSDAEYQNGIIELPVKLKELVENLVESDHLKAKQKKMAIEKEIAKILGTYRNKIYAWKREANLLDQKGKKPMNEFDEGQRYKLAKKFDRMRKEAYLAMNKLTKQRGKEIKRTYTDEERLAIVNHFMEIKEKYLAQTGPTTSMYCNELDREIAQKLGVNKDTIYKWKSKLGMSEKLVTSEAEKGRIMQKYIRLKKKNPKTTDMKLSKVLGISYYKMCAWKKRV